MAEAGTPPLPPGLDVTRLLNRLEQLENKVTDIESAKAEDKKQPVVPPPKPEEKKKIAPAGGNQQDDITARLVKRIAELESQLYFEREQAGLGNREQPKASGGLPPRPAPKHDANADHTPESTKTPQKTSGSSWFSNLSKALAGFGGADENQPETHLVTSFSSMTTDREPEKYYRYVFDPVDLEAERQMTAAVKRAAQEALAEAEIKIKAAQDAQESMAQQAQQAQALAEEVRRLTAANEATIDMKRKLEEETTRVNQELASMRQLSDTTAEELENLRQQGEIWKNNSSTEANKLRAENELIKKQLQTRLNELQTSRTRVNELEANQLRVSRDQEDMIAKMKAMQDKQYKLETALNEMDQLKRQVAEAEEKFLKERAVRRKLHEQLQTLKGNIRVMCRVRPSLPNQTTILGYPLDGLLLINPPDRRSMEFEFDHVFGPESRQEEVFAEVKDLIRSCADGYNVCIFAYGQTGSGKTFTMQGPGDNPGINVRALQELFRIADEEGQEHAWQLSVSMIEIYIDQVHDLLRSASDVTKSLDVSAMGPGELAPGQERIPGLTWRQVTNIEDVELVLKEGNKNRTTASTAMNATSSRSHALLSVRVLSRHADGGLYQSNINLVDLAGSERVDRSEVTGQQLKEAQAINKSLSALGNVIQALQRRQAHIPFRDSKLTAVLQDSLSGSSKVMLVCNISPEPASSSETLSSLNFASRAAQVELGAARKVGPNQGSPGAGERSSTSTGNGTPREGGSDSGARSLRTSKEQIPLRKSTTSPLHLGTSRGA